MFLCVFGFAFSWDRRAVLPVSHKLKGKDDGDKLILLLWIVVRHGRSTFQIRASEFGLEGEYLVLGSLEVFPKLQVDLQSLLAGVDVLPQLIFK